MTTPSLTSEVESRINFLESAIIALEREWDRLDSQGRFIELAAISKKITEHYSDIKKLQFSLLRMKEL